MLLDDDTSLDASDLGPNASQDSSEWEESQLEAQREFILEMGGTQNRIEDEEPDPFDPTVGLDDSVLSGEVRWLHSRSWWGNSSNDDWCFIPSQADHDRGWECLEAVSSVLRNEAGLCVNEKSRSASYWKLLNCFLFLHKVVHAWWLELHGLCCLDTDDSEHWHSVLDRLWRKTPEHHALEKMIRDQPGAKARKKAYDAVVKKTPEALEKARLANRASRARKKTSGAVNRGLITSGDCNMNACGS